jgi:hypothetical protein
MYLLTPVGIAEKANITRRYLVRKETEYQQLKHEIDRLKTEVERF